MTLSRPQVLAVVAGLVAAGLVLALWPREDPGPEEAVKRQIIGLTRAAERRQVGEVLEGVSGDFRSKEGWSKDDLKGVLALHLLRNTWVRLFITDLETRAVSPREVHFSAKFIFGSSDAPELQALARESVLSAYGIEGAFHREEDGEWRVLRAQHRRLSPVELF